MSKKQESLMQFRANEMEAEISLSNIVKLFRNYWKIIFIFVFFGVVGSIAYIVISPKMYEATAQIRMAQISQVNPANPFGTPVEDPSSLISRMQFPTNYPSDLIEACGYKDKPEAGLALSKSLKFTSLKGVANTVELKVISSSKQMAGECANAVFLQVQILQEQMSKPFVDEAKAKLIADNDRIDAARRLIARADQSGGNMSVAYLSARDELTYFLTDREKMADLINSVKNRGTRLASPIYVSDYPVSPRKDVILAAGLLAGLFVGLFISLSHQALVGFKRKTSNAL